MRFKMKVNDKDDKHSHVSGSILTSLHTSSYLILTTNKRFNFANLLNVSWPYLSIFYFLSFQIGFSYRRVWALEQAGSLTQQQCGILVPRPGSNLHPLYWKADS